MADHEQVLQVKMAISQAFGVDTPTAPPLTSDGGGVTPYGEYSLFFKMILALRGSAERASQQEGKLLISNSVPHPTFSPDSVTLTSDGKLDTINYESFCSASRLLRWWFKLLAHLMLSVVWPKMMLNTLHSHHFTQHGMTLQVLATSSSRRTMVA